jgi:phosphoribosylanthranilate isomerase
MAVSALKLLRQAGTTTKKSARLWLLGGGLHVDAVAEALTKEAAGVDHVKGECEEHKA